VLAHDLHPPTTLPPGVRLADPDTIFAQSDVVSLHCPLTAENKGFVNARRLATMKQSAFLINTSRGPLVDETDLAAALNAGRFRLDRVFGWCYRIAVTLVIRLEG